VNIIKFKTSEVYPLVEIFYEFFKLYKLIANHNYINFMRWLSVGDGKIYITLNNLDMRLKFNLDIDKDIIFDKIYPIEEFYNIVKSMNVYPTFELNLDNNIINFGDDADFSLVTVEMEEKVKEEIFNSKELKIGQSDLLKINDVILKEFKNIKMILNLKNQNYPNYYFYKDEHMIFNLFNIYVKKYNNLIDINSDIIGFKFLVYLFEKKLDEQIEYGIKDGRFIFKCARYYVEGRNCVFDGNERHTFILDNFDNFNCSNTIELKLEFYNFVNTVYNIDNTCCLVFDDENVRIQSNNTDVTANFKIEGFEGFFIIHITILMKLLSFMLSYNAKIEDFKINLGISNNTKWAQIQTGDVLLLTEIMADLADIKTEEDIYEEEKVEL
jgi:hypothetical protein